jgi:hypothetical protein
VIAEVPELFAASLLHSCLAAAQAGIPRQRVTETQNAGSLSAAGEVVRP